MSTNTHGFLIAARARARRLGRWLSSGRLLLGRALTHRGKRRFVKSLLNTYLCNYINLSLVFRRQLKDRAIRRLARRAVGVFVRNGIDYLAPRLWRGFVVRRPEILEAAFARGSGVVVACQHLGPQRFSLIEVAAHGRPVHVAITENFIDRLNDWKARVIDDSGQDPAAHPLSRVHPLPVEAPTCALKMVRALKRREVVMFDVDGNVGVGREERTLAETLTLPFLGRDIHVRKGVAYLSYRTGAPIVPVITRWGADGRAELIYHPPLLPEAGEELESYAERALQHLYGLLEEQLLATPEQWEMWPQFYKWLSPPDQIGDDHAVEDEVTLPFTPALGDPADQRIGVRPEDAFVLRIRGQRVLVDSRHFRFFLITKTTESLLRRLHAGTTVAALTGASKPERSSAIEELTRLHRLNLLWREG